MKFSYGYLHAVTKKYDGIEKGSSGLWSMRMEKAYGILPLKFDHNYGYSNLIFDYSDKQISIARKFRCGFYERILKPEHIIQALRFSPITTEIEIFNSAHNDDGCFSIPDLDEDVKEDIGHCVLILEYEEKKESFIVSSNWHDWGNNGYGYLSLEYLKKYFVSAFVAKDRFVGLTRRSYLVRKKIKINNLWYSFTIFKESSFLQKSLAFNIEINHSGGTMIGWIHFSVTSCLVEIQEIFVLNEYRNKGVGTFLLKKMMEFSRCKEVTGYISAYDLLNSRDENVKCFFIKNGLTVTPDNSKFMDCKDRIIQL